MPMRLVLLITVNDPEVGMICIRIEGFNDVIHDGLPLRYLHLGQSEVESTITKVRRSIRMCPVSNMRDARRFAVELIRVRHALHCESNRLVVTAEAGTV